MAKFITAFAVASTCIAAVQGLACDPTAVSPYAGQKANLVPAASFTPSNEALHVSGTVEILDSCTFVVRNFVFTPGLADTLWYGRVGTNVTSGRPIWGATGNVNTTVQYSNGADSQNYTLIGDETGWWNAQSWNDFDTIVLYGANNSYNYTMATVQFPALIKTTSTSIASSTSSSTTTSTKAAATTTSTSTSSTAEATTTTADALPKDTVTTTPIAQPTEDVKSGARGIVELGSLAVAGLAAVCAAAVGL
ncbi:uncharacterized protein EV422DRAFT_512755 [Fimicolochytrium jonesii]|uniref:uncharacterized protein n=1 Tax=Fimicolochytrium jonesii TaxID=1396493 RepID=UPI0022FEE3C6|nr:uncharacterized protein EV422DRAFT_512755 [Fimicolochytrium jonesii]KAI8827125.1 hypothetical protein EV422DRAFT_512755 [Fimicolochytrium jonesii]